MHLEPVCLLTGSLKVHTAKFYAKEHNEKHRLILLTLACGTKLLADSDMERELQAVDIDVWTGAPPTFPHLTFVWQCRWNSHKDVQKLFF